MLATWLKSGIGENGEYDEGKVTELLFGNDEKLLTWFFLLDEI